MKVEEKRIRVEQMASELVPPHLIEAHLGIKDIEKFRKEYLRGITKFYVEHSSNIREQFFKNFGYFKYIMDLFGVENTNERMGRVEALKIKDEVENAPKLKVMGMDD